MRFTLLNNYVHAAVRNIFKNKTFSAINHADISVLDTLSGPVLVILVGMITTGIITFFAARSNPATILRNE